MSVFVLLIRVSTRLAPVHIKEPSPIPSRIVDRIDELLKSLPLRLQQSARMLISPGQIDIHRELRNGDAAAMLVNLRVSLLDISKSL